MKKKSIDHSNHFSVDGLHLLKIITCTPEYSSQILDIFNDAILNTTALYEYQPWTLDTIKTWFELKKEQNFPIIGIVDVENHLLGFGTYGVFRMRPAYKYTVENSLYVHKDFRGKGLGKILLGEIIKNAKAQHFHCIVSVIDASNGTSVRLHKSYGFGFIGRIKQVGFKFNRWLDVDLYQLILSTPEHPVDG
ncbi:MAG: N-acetyltransferase family protein [Paludibacter sp.]|nr:N-acetyltransferase family protein [Paludibacter sp.]